MLTTVLWMALAAAGTFVLVRWWLRPEPVTGETFDKSIVVTEDPALARTAVSYQSDAPGLDEQHAVATAVGLIVLVRRHRPELALHSRRNIVGAGVTVVLHRGIGEFDVWISHMRNVTVAGHWLNDESEFRVARLTRGEREPG